MKKTTMLPFLIACLLLAGNVNAFNYEITYYGNSNAGASVTTNISGFYGTPTDTIDLFLTSRAAFNGTGTYDSDFYSPLSTIFMTTTGTVTSNRSCRNLGIANKSYSAENVEDQVVLVHTASYGLSYGDANYNITTSERFYTVSTADTDTNGFSKNIYGIQDCDLGGGGGASVVAAEFNSANFGICLVDNVFKVEPTWTTPASCGVGAPEGFHYVLFNSKQGNLTYLSSFSGTVSAATRHFVYIFDDTSSLTSLCTNAATCSGETTLTEDTLYVYAVSGVYPTGQSKNTPLINLTLDLAAPDYLCGEYGECGELEDNFQQRVCIDQNGIQPDLIETRICSLIILENATLGFEEFVTDNYILKCLPNWVLPGGWPLVPAFCSYTLFNVSIDRPVNWTIVDPAFGNQYFVSMAQEWATEGTRSVKLWYIPPKTGEPIDAATCGNLTEGRIPQMFRNVSNSTFSIFYNVTFPAENMLLSFDTKKCSNQVLQHSALTGLFNLTLCPRNCYAENCDIEPNGRYYFNLIDLVTNQSVLGSPFFDEAETFTDTIHFDLSNLGLVAGRFYNIVFAVFPENLNDRTGDCVLFDFVRYEVLEEPFETLCGPDCTSRCIDEDYLQCRRLPNGNCQAIMREFSANCLDPDIAALVEEQESYCDDENNLHQFNEKIGKYEIILESEFCVEEAAITEEEEALQETVGLGFLGIDLGIFNFFFSVFMIANYIIIALAGVAGHFVDWKFGGIVTLILIMALTFGGIYPLEIALVIGAGIGLLVANDVKKGIT